MLAKIRFVLLFTAILVVASCIYEESSYSKSPETEEIQVPTPASTLQELILNITSERMDVRLVSIYELDKYGQDAVIAIPNLVINLYAEDKDVRVAAATALGRLGQNAQKAVPDLVNMLKKDSYIHARAAAAEALGRIGDRNTVPNLADALYDENSYDSYEVAIFSSVAIVTITGEEFSDFDSSTGYQLNTDGIPLIVIEARNWWENIGQFEDWSIE